MNGPELTSRTECSIETGFPTSSFVMRPLEGGDSLRLTFYGDALLSPELLAHVAEAQPSFPEAVRRAVTLAQSGAGTLPVP